jgi:GAF domain-containing protein
MKPGSSIPSSLKRFRKQPLVGGQIEISGILNAVRAGRCCRLIGPRYHHKSQIMHAARAAIDQQLGYTSIYLSLWDARITSDTAFYSSLRDLAVSNLNRYYHRRLPHTELKTPADLRSFLSNLPGILKSNVVIFIDDLEAAWPDYVSELLIVLRAAYQSTAAQWRFLTVVCASHGLARNALGPTSPFENISDLILVGDFSRAETSEFAARQLAKACPRPTAQALHLIHEQTGGDRTLVSEVCHECCLLAKRQGKRRITPEVVDEALTSLMQHGGREALAEDLRQIENDPELLRNVLRIMREGKVPANEIDRDPSVQPDPLTTSGFIRLDNRQFTIKSDLHYRLLQGHFTPERLSRIFLAAGDWESVIRHLGVEIQPGNRGTAEERARVMLGAVSTMYSVANKHDAFGCLALGFENAYPHLQLRLYDYDRERNILVRIDPLQPAARTRRTEDIPIDSTQHPEVRALRSWHEFWLQPTRHHRLTLYVPLRPSPEDIQGLVAVEQFITRSDYRRKQESMAEMVGYLRHAARALQNRAEYERLYGDIAQRAQDLQHLLMLMRRLMNSKGSYQDILDQTLRSAASALGRQAQMGSIYLYDRSAGRLTIRSHTGYSQEVRQEAQFIPGRGLAGYVYKTGRLWIVHDTRNDLRYQQLNRTPDRVRSTIGVPLRGRSGILGVLCLDSLKHTHAFTEESEKLLMLFAGQVAPWLENARLVDILRDLHDTAIELLDLSQPDAQSLLETVASRLLHTFELNVCAIGQRESPSTLRFAVRRGLPDLPDKIELTALPARLLREVLTAGQVLIINDLHAEPEAWSEFLRRADLTALIALPLRDDHEQHGVMLLGCIGEFNPADEESNLLLTFANQVALALENAALYGQVHGELRQNKADLQLARWHLEMAHEQEMQYRNARLATGLFLQQPRLLLVAGEADISLTLPQRLKSEGYEVTLVTDYQSAGALLTLQHFHAAIIDARFPGGAADQSLLQLLRDVDLLGLRGIMACLIITAIGTQTMALQELRAEMVIEKVPELYVTELLGAIRMVFDKYRLSFSIEYVADTLHKIEQGAQYIRPEGPDWPPPERTVLQIEDLLGKLFYTANRLWIDRIHAGLSGSLIMEAQPTWPSGLGQSKVVKIGRSNKTHTEEDNYRRHVEHFLPARHATQLNTAYTQHLGGLLYTFVEMEAEDTINFNTYYQQHTTEQINDALHRLFTVTCRLWYQGRTPPDNESLRDMYLDAFNLSNQPDRLAREIASFRPEYVPGDPTISFILPGVTLPNPLHWLAHNEAVMPVCRSITHGDLQADNILMNDAGDCWLIDFYRTYPSHILRDFIELETDIKFRLMGDLTPEEFARLEETLIELQHPAQALTLPGGLPETAQKAAHVIAGLRAEAWHLLDAIQPNVRLIQREYLTGLLLGTLNILRLRHFKENPGLQPRRELALLSAAMICQHLQ